MNPDSVKQIVETIKTLNLNVDSQTAVEMTKELTPLIYFYFIKGVVIDVLSLIAFVVAIYFISKAVRSYYTKREGRGF